MDMLPRSSPADNSDTEGAVLASPSLSLSPLRVSALVVDKADLVAALRVYVPQLTDLRQMDDGRFLLILPAADE